jgi:hypothetical protein
VKRSASVQVVSGRPDRESLAIGKNSTFLAIMERSRAAHLEQGGISPDEMRRYFGIKSKKTAKRRTSR